MSDVEFALRQGPSCLLAGIRKRWPRLEVQVESVVAFYGGLLLETAVFAGSDVRAAMQAVKIRAAEGALQIFEEGEADARFRLEVRGCPLVPLLVDGGFRPKVPFRVAADSDRWIVEDKPERLEQVFGMLQRTGVMPMMIRKDPDRRP